MTYLLLILKSGKPFGQNAKNLTWIEKQAGSEWGSMDAINQSPAEAVLPKHILDIWVIVLIILATIVIMTSLLLCPATAVIIYRMRTHPVLNGGV
ncbi:PREDICTED: small integral membrane protein 3 isoform X1 [Chinchilla lanigera]|nr:PREDICTED: small integral membrane protein 3 isoform X1 [Chinchilla lanigera]